MNVLLIGSGGREHALAWKIARSSRLSRLYIAPGNAGTRSCGENVPLNPDDRPSIIQFCQDQRIDLVVVGPEGPLAAGLTDTLSEAGLRCFGPGRAAARIEASKAFAKNFMARHHVPTARYATFTRMDDALAHLESVGYPVVIKASGLAAGKGVILPDSREEAQAALKSMLVEGTFGESGREVVIEERLTGEEISLMAFTDGKAVATMPAAQDHKRLLDGDRGPNTGGMGSYAPVPFFTPELAQAAIQTILVPTINGLRLEGNPFVGVLYAGLILTAGELRVLEFNCRFGDPETQAVLPLLATDLLDILEACVDGRLENADIQWKNGAAACVVLSSSGYPENVETGSPITLRSLPENMVCFQAGTKYDDGRIVTSGGRVLGLTAWSDRIESAIEQVYSNVHRVSFEGMHYRTDVARRARKENAYAAAGVSIQAGNRAVDLMKEAVKSTYTSAVLAGIGSFAGSYDASALKRMKNPVLVASTDGVGTKVKLAASIGCYGGIGHDIVNHCINDILVQGARPLFFMDYFAASRLDPEQTAKVVTGIGEACREAGMALLGGETAEMPGVYQPQEFDVAGTIVGAAERDELLPRTNLQAGDALIGISSSGPHTNGYSLIRKILAETPLDASLPELGCTLAEALLAPHRSYLSILYPLLAHVKALAHITGGGFIDNIPRALPEGLGAEIYLGSWPVPPLWNLIQSRGDVSSDEMYHVFNMGIGMVVIADQSQVARLQAGISEPTFVIGRLIRGQKTVVLA